MSNVSENMSKLEQEAQELVTKLGELNKQVASYKEAKESLQETNQRLNSLIETTKNLTEESQSIISKFNEISGAKFIERVEDVNEKISILENILTSANRKNRLGLLVIAVGIIIIVILQVVKMLF